MSAEGRAMWTQAGWGTAKYASAQRAWTCLHYACWQGNEAMVRLLLDSGLVNTDSYHFGPTPFATACYFGHVDIVRLFLERGAAADRPDHHGFRAIHFACLGASDAVVSLFAIPGVYVNATISDGRTPFFMACEVGASTAILDKLLARRADVNHATRYDGITPLMRASFLGQEAVVLWLLDHGASVDAVERVSKCRTPLHFACEGGRTAIALVLVDRGASMLATTAQFHGAGETPAAWARTHGHAELAALLEARATSAS